MNLVAEKLPSSSPLAMHIQEVRAWPMRTTPVETSNWVVDREGQAFLVRTASGNWEDQHFAAFALWFKGSLFYIALTQMSEGRFDEHVKVTWELRSMDAQPGVQIDHQEIIPVLKAALSAYGVFGAALPVSSFESKFNF